MIYLDEQATTRLDPAVRVAMEPWWDVPSNAHSMHRHGLGAHAAVEVARVHVATLIGAPPETITFTSGATEANNWALIGALTHGEQTRRRLVTLATEHSAVLEPARFLERLGIDLAILPVAADGIVRLEQAMQVITRETALVSAMLVNNEIGIVQPITELARLARAAGALMHTDAAQAFGKIPIDVDALGVDLLSMSGHKIYGPQGIGALYVRPGTRLAPIFHGGGQEPGRSGTVPTALAVGLGEAARIAGARMGKDADHADALWDRAVAALAPAVPKINGSIDHRWRGNLNITLLVRDGPRLLSDVTRTVSLSSGAACASAAGRDSHVLAALGRTPQQARASLRLGWGRFTTEHDLDRAAAAIVAAVRAQAA